MTDELRATKTIIERATEPDGPFSVKNLIPTLWMLAISIFGGIVSFYHKVKMGKARPLNLTELLGEMFTSALAGLITYWVCKHYMVDEYLTAAGVAIAGHMGARGLFMLESWLERKAAG